jgi:hypothetical protein
MKRILTFVFITLLFSFNSCKDKQKSGDPDPDPTQQPTGTTQTEEVSSDLSLFKDIVVTSTAGQTTLTDSCLLSLTTGEVFQLKDGAKYATKVDAIFTTYCGVSLYFPAKIIRCDFSCGTSAMNSIIKGQNWPVYRTGSILLGNGYFSAYPQIFASQWPNIKNAADITNLGYNSLNPANDFSSVIIADTKNCPLPDTLDVSRLFIFVTKEGKRGVIRVKSMTVKTKTSKFVLDIKVQK